MVANETSLTREVGFSREIDERYTLLLFTLVMPLEHATEDLISSALKIS